MMMRFLLVMLLACVALPAHAEWVRRVTDGIMGTRITVELWSDDRHRPRKASRRCCRRCATSMRR